MSAGRKNEVQMTHQLNTLFSTAIKRRLMLLAACLLLSAAQTWAWVENSVAVYDASTKTLYFDRYVDNAPTVGQSWTTSQGESITVSAFWEANEVLNTGNTAPGWQDCSLSDGYIRDNCTKVVFEDGFYYSRPTSLCEWFHGFSKLKYVEGLYNLHTSEVTNMSFMFAGCSGYGSGSSYSNNPNTLNLHGFDTQKVTDMSYMFYGCTNLYTVYLSSFNTANVTDMTAMFNGCSSLYKIYVDENLWSTAGLTNAGIFSMFNGCTAIKGGNFKNSSPTSYNSNYIGDEYARVSKSGAPGYLSAGGPYALWCEDEATLYIGFGQPPYSDSDTWLDMSTMTQHNITNRWIGELNYKDDPSNVYSRPVWTKDNNAVKKNCTKVVFTSTFAQMAKRMVMYYWFNQFIELTTVEGFENLELGTGTNGMFFSCSKLTSITLPATIREIGYDMFRGCGFTAFNIPAGVTKIGLTALTHLHSLPAFTVDAGNTHFKAVDGVLFTADGTELVAYPAGKTDTEYTIPSTVQTIREGAFSNSQNLTSVIIPYGISKIPDDAFYHCQNLTSVNIPSGAREIDNWAFDACDLSSVIIPSSVTTINNYAFDRNSNLAEVKVYSRVPPTLSNGENDFSHFTTLYVPKGSKTDYVTSNWNQYCDNIVEFDVETDVTDLDDAFYIRPFRAGRDGDVTIDICLKNAQTATAYNFDLLLPKGVTVVENSATLSTRHGNTHSLTFNDKGNNTYSFAVLSGNSAALADNDGAIIRVTLHVADNVAVGKYAIDIAGASYSEPNGTTHILGTSISSIDILEGMPGDVNGNGFVDIGDAVSIVNYLVSKPVDTFIPAAADTNHNGSVDIGDAVTIVNYLVGKSTNLSRTSKPVGDERDPE